MSIKNPMENMKFENQKAAKAYLKELKETYQRLPVMFVYQDPDCEFACQVQKIHRHLINVESRNVLKIPIVGDHIKVLTSELSRKATQNHLCICLGNRRTSRNNRYSPLVKAVGVLVSRKPLGRIRYLLEIIEPSCQRHGLVDRIVRKQDRKVLPIVCTIECQLLLKDKLTNQSKIKVTLNFSLGCFDIETHALSTESRSIASLNCDSVQVQTEDLSRRKEHPTVLTIFDCQLKLSHVSIVYSC